MKKIKYFVLVFFVIIAIIIIISIVKNTMNKINIKQSIANNIKTFLNEGKMNKNIVADGEQWLDYVKSSNVNEYQINDFIENYYDLIEKSIKAKINGTNQVSYGHNGSKFNYVKYDKIVEIYQGLTIHSLNDYQAMFIINCINESDIELYKSGKLKEVLFKKLEMNFKREGNNWYIVGNSDKHLELPYNVYIDYVANKKENVNKVKKITNIKILNDDLENIDLSEILPIKCNIQYINNNDEIMDEIIYLKFDDDKKQVLSMTNLGALYYKNQNRATLTAGQYDYDEAVRKEIEENPSEDMSHLNVSVNEGKENEVMQTISWEEFEELLNRSKSKIADSNSSKANGK